MGIQFLVLLVVALAACCMGFKKYVWFIICGCRLGGYLAVREIKSASYNTTMKNEIKDGSTMPMVAKISIWVAAAQEDWRSVRRKTMEVLLCIGNMLRRHRL
jgi:hypothetical protein